MFKERTCVGLDVHARSVVAVAIDTVTGEVFRARLSPAEGAVREWVEALPGPAAVVYEAGPTGYGLARVLSGAGLRCEVVAPSKLHRPPGDRVKTDERDAQQLAELLMMGQICPVRVPTPAQEAARDLVRAREDCRRDLARTRHRLRSLLLRYGWVYPGGSLWTCRHDQWLRAIVLEEPASRAALEEYYQAAVATLDRRDRLDRQIETMAADRDTPERTALVARLCCLRGVSTLTAFALAVEIGEWDRFTGASIGAFVGLTPSEHSSGQTRRLGSITRAGNTHVRRLLVEAAWHHRRPYRPSAALRARWEKSTPAAQRRGDLANRRLHHRWARFDARSKKSTIANTAIARELAGWCWSLAVMDTTGPELSSSGGAAPRDTT